MLDTKILIVDDEPTMRDLLRMHISSLGISLMTAEDGLDAVKKLQENDFTIVLTDMMMPNMDGMELLEHIRTNFPEIDVIVITAFGDSFSYTDVIDAGASDFLKKPYQINELEAKINRVIREQKLITELKETADALESQLQEKNSNLEELKAELQNSLDRLKYFQAQTILTKYGKPRIHPNLYKMKKTPKTDQEK